MNKFMALKPRVSEKAYGLSQKAHTYVFDVPMSANVTTIAAAVASQFDVTVEDVRTLLVKGKVKRSYRKRSRPAIGSRVDVKKAYVRLKDGDSIAIFGAAEDDKADKKAAKKAKETK